MIYYAASDLPDEWRSPPGTRGANARLGTFQRLTGHNMPDISSFTYWLGSSSSGDFNAATHEVAGTGWSITEMFKGIIWQLRKLLSDYEEHKLQQRDLESQNTAHAAATLDSFTQVRGILDHLRADGLALRAELVAMRSESVHGATLAALDRAIVAVQAEQQRLQRLIWDQAAELATVAQQTARVEESVRLYELAYSGRLDEIATSHLNLQNQFRGERVRNERVEHVELVQVWTRIDQESTRTGHMWKRLEELEAGTNRSGYATHLSGYAKLRIDKLEQELKREREDGADTSE